LFRKISKKIPIMPAIQETSDSKFEEDVLKEKKAVLVDFFAPWCGPCKVLAPLLEEIFTDQEISDKVKLIKLNTDENPHTAQVYRISGIPNLIIFKDGKPFGSKVGVDSKEELIKFIRSSF